MASLADRLGSRRLVSGSAKPAGSPVLSRRAVYLLSYGEGRNLFLSLGSHGNTPQFRRLDHLRLLDNMDDASEKQDALCDALPCVLFSFGAQCRRVQEDARSRSRNPLANPPRPVNPMGSPSRTDRRKRASDFDCHQAMVSSEGTNSTPAMFMNLETLAIACAIS